MPAHKARQDAMDDGLLVRNPADRVTRPTPDRRREMTVWQSADAALFLAAIEGDRLEAMWLLFLAKGMAAGRGGGAAVGRREPRRPQIAVRNQRTCVDYEVVTNDPKTSASTATVAIGDGVAAALVAHRRRQVEERQAWGPAWIDTGCVFVQEDGQTYHPQRLTRMFARAVAQADVPVIRLHDLRHTCATLLIEAGVSLKVVLERIRHASYVNTADLGAHVTAGMQQQAAATIKFVLRRPG